MLLAVHAHYRARCAQRRIKLRPGFQGAQVRFPLTQQEQIGLWASQDSEGVLECLYLEYRPQLQVLFREIGAQVSRHADGVANKGQPGRMRPRAPCPRGGCLRHSCTGQPCFTHGSRD